MLKADEPTFFYTKKKKKKIMKGTQKDMTDKVSKANIKTIAIGGPEERLENEGAEPIGNSPDDFAAMMKTESIRWSEILKKASISVD